MREFQSLMIVSLTLISVACSDSPQQAELDFRPKGRVSHFSPHSGPIVLIDQAHHNFLTVNDRYKPFAPPYKSKAGKRIPRCLSMPCNRSRRASSFDKISPHTTLMEMAFQLDLMEKGLD